MVDDGACCHQRLFANLRALVDTRIVERVSHHPAPHPLRQLLLKPVVDALLHVDAARGDAGFSLPAPTTARRPISCSSSLELKFRG